MKICYLADGESVHTKRWCEHFAALGHEIHLISFKNVDLINVNVHYVDAGGIAVAGGNWKVLLKVPAIKRILKKIKPDLVHAHYATSYGVVGAMTGFHPFVITALGSDVLISPKNSKLYRMLLNYAFRRADWMTAMAPHMKIEMIALGADENRTDVVSFGIDPIVFNENGRIESKQRFVITSTRNFETIYNIQDFLLAASKVKSEIPDLEIHLTGDGSLRLELEKMVDDLGLRSITKFHGRIPQNQIAELLRKTNVFVTVSSSDGNNISLNEAMACGAFCIATAIPANLQWITDSENGFLVPVNNPQTLSERLTFTYRNYNSLQEKAQPLNRIIIAEKAIWSVNMKFVETRYLELSKK